MLGTQPHRVQASASHGRRFSNRRTKLPKIHWSGKTQQRTNRPGSGVRYGSLDLTPKDSYPQSHSSSRSFKHAEEQLKIAVLGGNEEVGCNMTLIEYGEDILLIDMGIQFAEEGMLGVDGRVPDLRYLRGKEHRVRGIIITHMHADHIGAIPFLLPQLPSVPIYSAPLTLAIIAKKLEYTPEVKADLRAVDPQTELYLGRFQISFFGVSHSVPAAMGVVIDTPVGKIVHTGDFKLDLNPESEDATAAYAALEKLGTQNILALMADSTNAPVPGYQIMEKGIRHDLEKIFFEAKGRLLFGMISTNIERLAQLIQCAEKFGRHVFIGGLSLKTNAEVAEQLGYLTPKRGTIVGADELRHLPAHKVVAIFPGAQGEANGAFYRLADGTQRDMQIEPGDTVVFSSSVIPGNERSVQFITDRFYRRGAKVFNAKMLDIHSGGHARQEDLKEVVKLVKPKYLIPIEGHFAFLHAHADAAKSVGFPSNRILIANNGQVMEFDRQGEGRLTNHHLSTERIFVRGKNCNHVDADTLRERSHIGAEGTLVAVCHMNPRQDQPSIHLRSYGIRKQEGLVAFYDQIERYLQTTLKHLKLTSSTRLPTVQNKIEQQLILFLETQFDAHPHVVVVVE